MLLKVVGIFILVLLAGVIIALAYAARRWRAGTEAWLAALERSHRRPGTVRYDDREIQGLPDPVKRYFQRTLRNGQPIVRRVRQVHVGEFLVGQAGGRWCRMAATQVHIAQPPGFVWDARIEMFPRTAVYVRDAYIAGAGLMRGRVLGLFPIVDVAGKPELAASALQRYLAEAIWFPTALLPSQGVQWTALNDAEARATLTDAGTTVSLDFRFNTEGEITGAYTRSRYAEVAGRFELRPWECRCSEYAELGGMRIPMVAEVAWHQNGKVVPYWRARVTEMRHEFEEHGAAVGVDIAS